MQAQFTIIDWSVLILYFVGVIGIGLYFSGNSRSSDNFTTGGRSLPGWLCGLSIFATFLSSISYLALPGKSFVDNWNPFVFSLALPLAALIAVRYFVPLYRSTGEVSAYALLERRFGAWARVYASAFYLLYQIARIGVVMYLMALPMAVIFGWDIRWIIVCTGIVVTVYAFIGGIVAVIWADAIQAIVLLAGALIAVAVILVGLPEGPGQVFQIANDSEKFSLGSSEIWTVSQPTIWIVLLFGLFENLKNFGIDQSYIQRYIAAKSDRDAARSLWISAGLYVPVSALFFFIGTSLFAWYSSYPDDLDQVRQIVARQRLMQQGVDPEFTLSADNVEIYSPSYQEQLDTTAAALTPRDLGDRVFPHFISAHLPQGLSGLLIAAVFAAAMSTVSTSLNSSATLVMSDFYQRFVRPEATDRQRMRVLHIATVVWGLLGTGMAIALVRLTESALDVWWTLSSVLGSGIVGLFLLGLISQRANSRAAIAAVGSGSLVIAWMVLSTSGLWPEELAELQSPFHQFLVIVVGTVSIVVIGCIAGLATSGMRPPAKDA
ncbi:sodium:solute symporter [Rosistilla oblonga]|uniref:Sodium/glucose cotransporter n=1 Tax=Rosistilla oblonga TaxID=2527990 RepID=A0A518IX76_9BACT|nr:sodium:solute symporter [Rosistilla oblonga]QDV57687.1 Sodium/glucose cotransporter [Rosistilla oblonga]